MTVDTYADNTVETRIPPQLIRSDTRGKGAAEIGWGTHGDWERCRKFLRRHGVSERMLDGACANLHKLATGEWPGPNAHKGVHSLITEALIAAMPAGFKGRRWSGPLAPIGTATGDGRIFPPGVLKYQSFPMPLRWQEHGSRGHDGAVTVGVIEGAEEKLVNGQPMVWGHGYFLDPNVIPEVTKAIHQVEHGVAGPSVDLDSYTAVFRPDLMTGKGMSHLSEGRTRAATLVPVPAFADLRLTLEPEETITASVDTVESTEFTVNANGWKGAPVAPREAQFDADDAVSRIEAWAGQDRKSLDKMFLWVNPNGDALGRDGYKLPWGDIIDGKPYLIYHAVYAAAALLSGAHGGLPNIPDDEKARLRGVITQIYSHLAQELGDPEIRAPWDRRPEDERVTEAALVEALSAVVEEFRDTKGGHRQPRVPGVPGARRSKKIDNPRGGEFEDVPSRGPHGQVKIGGKWVYPDKGAKNPEASARENAREAAKREDAKSSGKTAVVHRSDIDEERRRDQARAAHLRAVAGNKPPQRHEEPKKEEPKPEPKKEAPAKKAVAKKAPAKKAPVKEERNEHQRQEGESEEAFRERIRAKGREQLKQQSKESSKEQSKADVAARKRINKERTGTETPFRDDDETPVRDNPKVEAARERQKRLSKASAIADLASELDELDFNEADRDLMMRRVNAKVRQYEGQPGHNELKELQGKLEDAKTPAAMSKAAHDFAESHGLSRIGRAGKTERFDRTSHKPIAGDHKDKSAVHVARPGYKVHDDGEDLVLRKADVHEPYPGDEPDAESKKLTSQEAAEKSVKAAEAKRAPAKKAAPALTSQEAAERSVKAEGKTTVVKKAHKVTPAQQRALDALEKDPNAKIHPATRKVLEREGLLPKAKKEGSSAGSPEDQIRAAHADLEERPGAWVPLADIRERLGGMSREEQDAALRKMATQPGVQIIPWDNKNALSDRDHKASLRFGGDDNHAIRIEKASDAPVAEKIDDKIEEAVDEPLTDVEKKAIRREALGKMMKDQGMLEGDRGKMWDKLSDDQKDKIIDEAVEALRQQDEKPGGRIAVVDKKTGEEIGGKTTVVKGRSKASTEDHLKALDGFENSEDAEAYLAEQKLTNAQLKEIIQARGGKPTSSMTKAQLTQLAVRGARMRGYKKAVDTTFERPKSPVSAHKGVTIDEHKERLGRFKTREEALDYVAGVKGKDLTDLENSLSLGHGGSVADRRERIVERTVDSRLSSGAIRDGGKGESAEDRARRIEEEDLQRMLARPGAKEEATQRALDYLAVPPGGNRLKSVDTDELRNRMAASGIRDRGDQDAVLAKMEREGKIQFNEDRSRVGHGDGKPKPETPVAQESIAAKLLDHLGGDSRVTKTHSERAPGDGIAKMYANPPTREAEEARVLRERLAYIDGLVDDAQIEFDQLQAIKMPSGATKTQRQAHANEVDRARRELDRLQSKRAEVAAEAVSAPANPRATKLADRQSKAGQKAAGVGVRKPSKSAEAGETLDGVEERRPDLAERATGRTAVVKKSQPAFDSKSVRDRLASAESREEADKALDGLTVAQLRQVASDEGVTIRSGAPKAEIRKGIVELRVGRRLDSEAIHPGPKKATPPSAPDAPSKAEKAAEKLPESKAAPEKVTGGKIDTSKTSSKPRVENTWGGHHREGQAYAHPDGDIPLAAKGLGREGAIEVDGDRLDNVLDKIATDTVLGRTTGDEQVEALRALARRFPEGSSLRGKINDLADGIDAPKRKLPESVEGAPKELQDLADFLLKFPLARGGSDSDAPTAQRHPSYLDALDELLKDWHAGKISPLRLSSELNSRVYNRRHESKEGKVPIDRRIADVVSALYDAVRQPGGRDRLTPPSRRQG